MEDQYVAHGHSVSGLDPSLFGGWGTLGGPGSMIDKCDVAYKSESKAKYINNYMLGEVLGCGSYGKVREAIDCKSAKRVAIKILNKRYLRKRTKDGEECVKREMKIMKKLKGHVNVLELIDVINAGDKEKLYIVLELVTGGSLQQLLDISPSGILPDGQAKMYFRQLITGLDFIHRKGVVHRDIKPGNLMITPEHVVKISDLGSAEILECFQEDTCTKYSGSPAFLPPEVASGREKFSGFKVDIWAAGVTLYLMVTGKLPFEGNSPLDLFENIQKGEFVIPDFVQDDCANLLRKMLSFREEDRPPLQEIMKHPWLLQEHDFSHDSGKAQEKWVRQRLLQRQPSVITVLEKLYPNGSPDSSPTTSPVPKDPPSFASAENALLDSKLAVRRLVKRLKNVFSRSDCDRQLSTDMAVDKTT